MGGDIVVGVGVVGGGVANNQWSQRKNCKTSSCLWAEFTAGAVHLPKKGTKMSIETEPYIN